MSEPLSDGEVATLRSIMKAFTAPEWRALKALASGLASAAGGASNGASAGGQGPAVATDAELRDRYGDPSVRRDSRRWAGASYVGANYSRCPSDYLLVLAESLEYFADKDQKKPEPKCHANGTPFWKFDLKNAALARGWARRNEGKQFAPPVPAASTDDPYASRDDGGGESLDQSAEPSDASEWAP